MFSLISDIHLEKNIIKNVVKNILKYVKEERTLILAGDIVTYNTIDKLDEFFMNIRPYYNDIYYVLGNHEYIGANIMEYNTLKNTYQDICSYHEVILLENNYVKNPFKIYGTTLWTNPYKHLKVNEKNNAGLDFYRKSAIYSMHKNAIENIIKHSDIDILVTHHLPSFSLIDKKYSNYKNKHMFASNSEFLFNKTKIFVHGHTHTRLDLTRDSLRIICNPYVNDSYFRPLYF